MAHSARALPQKENRSLVPPTITLALWRLRQVWGLLFITCIGMIAAVMLACTVPLYSLVAMSAGVRGILTAAPQNADITVFSISHKVSPSVIEQTTAKLNQELQHNLGRYINPPQFSLQSQVLPITKVLANPDGSGAYQPGGDKISVGLVGTPMEQTAPHLALTQGRLPQDGSITLTGSTSPGKTAPAIEIALTPETAIALHVNVGSTLLTSVSFINGNLQNSYRPLALHVVGIFRLPTTDDAFWHGEDFHYFQPDDFHTIYRALVANPALLTALAHVSNDPTLKDSVFQAGASVLWYYHINTSRISINDVGNIVNSIKIVKVDNANNPDFEQSPYLQETQTFVPTDTESASLEQYNSRTEVARLAVNSLLILIICLLLFFVSMMVDLLIDRQADSIAILRSRGASKLQVFGAMVTQGIGLALLALLVGPILAIPLTRFLIEHSLSPSDQSALNLIAGDPVQVILGVRLYILLAIGAAILATIIAILRSISLDVLTVRREAARTSHRPLWQHWNLDMVAAIVSLIGFGISLYVTSAGILDQRAALLLLSPLTVLGAVFLLIGGLLILLRFFPSLMQISSRLTAQSRGAAPLLAVAQMARTPRQSMRMILLLALAIAFSIFTFVATASQAQRIFDVTSYQAGADFSGTIPVNIVTTSLLADTTTAYKHIPGVLSASLGYVQPITAGRTREGISIDFKAVDADTFAQATVWTPQDSSQSLDSLMKQLATQRQTAISHQLLPAIVDAPAWNALHLSPGEKFTLNVSPHDYEVELLNFTATAQVQHIPTANSDAGPVVLVDYRSFASVYKDKFSNESGVVVPANTVWLRTVDDPGALNGIRQTLAKGDLRLQFVYDRRALAATLYREPLYLTLSGILGLGAVTALLLALVGNLIASWLSVRSRLTSFTVLRALGATPGQIAAALTWEQCLIYITAILLGTLLGAIFSALAVPALTFTGTTPSGVSSSISNGAFYLAQTIPPIQIVVPPSLSIALAVFLCICIISLGLMVRVVSRPSMSQTLRLNED